MVKPLIYHQYMHNLYTIFSKILKICKQFGDNLINEKGNIPRPGVVPKFSDIEVIALNLTVSTQFRASPFERALFSALNRVLLIN